MNALSTDRRQERREAKLATILIESWRLAHRDGLAAISLRDLADAAGLREPSSYVYFASKADLYAVMFADGCRQMLEFLCARRYDGPPQEALARFVADCVRFASENVVRHQLLFQRTIPGFEPSPQSHALAGDFYAVGQRLAHTVAVATQPDLDQFSALVSGLAHRQVANDPGGQLWVRLAERVVRMFLADVEQRQQITNRRNPR